MLNNWIFIDDFKELWIKINQRGTKFILSKFNFLGYKRTISSFSTNFQHANWWIIPLLKERHNLLITGDRSKGYEEYISEKYFNSPNGKLLISLGCGAGNHEIKLAELNKDLQIVGYDISEKLIDQANRKIIERALTNIKFLTMDVYKIDFEKESIDYFLFNASLHHFKNIRLFIEKKLKPSLSEFGLIIINEYVGPNRMNFSNDQIEFCNRCLKKHVSIENRKILGLNTYKDQCYRLGKLRMYVSDPSECVDSESILPVLRNEFRETEYVSLGGNILMPTLKHIAHHFVNRNESELLTLIDLEKDYLKNHSSDFVFAVYQKR